jgi:AcrR family transcriptional regulator
MTPRRRLNRDEKRAITRTRLLEAARKVFGRRGYYGASLDEIAADAGFSKGALYYNFGSKEGLFLALLEERLQERVRIIGDAFQNERTASDAIQRIAREYLESLSQRQEFLLLYFEFWAHAVREPKFRPHLVAQLRNARQGLAKIIEDWGGELGVSPREAERFAVAANALAVGLSVEKSVDPEAVADDLFGAMLVRLFQLSADGQQPQR